MTRNSFKVVSAVPLDKLLLDTNNPRIRAGSDQPDCIERLLRKPKQLLALARDIAGNGLSTAPILAEPVKGGNFIVWDGNRRVTALKLLNEPLLCRNKALQAQFAGVAAKATVPIPSKIDVMTSSDKQALLKEVLARHSGALDGAGQLNWDALLRTMFLLGHKAVPKDYRLAGLLLRWAEENDIEVGDDFPISTIHRFLNKRNLERLGFKDNQSDVEPTVDNDIAARVVERLVLDFGPNSRFDVNEVYSEEQRDAYVTSLLVELGLEAKPETRTGVVKKGKGEPKARPSKPDDDKDPEEQDGAEGATKRPSGRKPAPSKPDWDRKTVVRSSFRPELPEDAWKPDEVLRELRRTETQRSPLATAALFRIFFELSTRSYMKRHRLQVGAEMHRNALVAAEDMRKHGRIDLGEFDAAKRRFKDKSQAEALLQYATLNDYMHSFKHMPDRQSLHVLWVEVQPYLEACWDDSRRPR